MVENISTIFMHDLDKPQQVYESIRRTKAHTLLVEKG